MGYGHLGAPGWRWEDGCSLSLARAVAKGGDEGEPSRSAGVGPASAGRPAAGGQDREAAHDERLLRAAQRGELASFNALVARHERAVYGVCLRVLRDLPAAEDATQDTFLKAWTAVGSFRGGLVRPWLLRIATNRCYDLLRARGRRPADSLDALAFETEPRWTSQAPPGESPEAFAARAELSVHLERALAALPDDWRATIVLADIQGYAYEEVAVMTGVAVGVRC
jgi:RNA polymerase sigma-70 factor (ECF subfamily)